MELGARTVATFLIAAVCFTAVLGSCNTATGKKVETFSCTKSSRQTYYSSCGFFGWSRCSRYRTVYTIETCEREVDCPGECNLDTTCTRYVNCIVNGGWTDFDYGSWSVCTATCGGGVQRRTGTRSCTSPTPKNGGSGCSGSTTSIQTRTCNSANCPPINGGWTSVSYGAWSTCSKTCGGGTQTRSGSRTCTNPRPQYGGSECSGSSTVTQTKACNTQNCPINGGWSDFSYDDWSVCSVTCGGGTQMKSGSRLCNNPTPQYGGSDCSGPKTDTQTKTCNTQHCPVDGGWSLYTEFTEWSQCDATCGGGKQHRKRRRTCTNPEPQYNGKDCIGEEVDQQSRDCNTNPCPIDGGWSDYSKFTDWTQCSVTCGGGKQERERHRTCSNPEPQYNGKNCVGEEIDRQSQDCNSNPCPIDGGWSKWGLWGPFNPCPVSCGGGFHEHNRTRTCDNPLPQHGGKPCEGSAVHIENQKCNTYYCPIDGGWSSWGEWGPFSPCPVTCGGGFHEHNRTRTCDNPKPQYFGKDCSGSSIHIENQKCNTYYCPSRVRCPSVHTKDVRNDSSCSSVYAKYMYVPFRRRHNTEVLCQWRVTQSACKRSHKCKVKYLRIVDGGWTEFGEFSEWEECSAECDGGTQDRSQTRSCTNPKPQYWGKPCDGSDTNTETQDCNTHQCPETICREKVNGYHAHPTQKNQYLHCKDSRVYIINCSRSDLEWSDELQTCNFASESEACEEGEYLPHSTDCSRFIQCSNDGVGVSMKCGPGTIWDSSKKACNNEGSVTCDLEDEEDPGDDSNESDPASACTLGEYLPHPTDCSKYIQCTANGVGFYMSCPFGLRWDKDDKVCKIASDVSCDSENGGDSEDDSNGTDSGTFVCPQPNGYFPDPSDCTKYYQCSWGTPSAMQCTSGMLFDQSISMCNWASDILRDRYCS